MEKQEVLFNACKSDNVGQLKQALEEERIDLNQIKDSDNESPLCVAILNGSFNVVKELLKRHVQVDEIGNLPLKYAIHRINIPIIELLIQNGADINKEVSSVTSYRPTPLNFALELDRDYRTDDEIDKVCECLITAGVNLYSPNKDGESPVIGVIKHRLLKSLDAMLSRNIDLTKIDGHYKVTPVEFAKKLHESYWNKDIIVNKLVTHVNTYNKQAASLPEDINITKSDDRFKITPIQFAENLDENSSGKKKRKVKKAKYTIINYCRDIFNVKSLIILVLSIVSIFVFPIILFKFNDISKVNLSVFYINKLLWEVCLFFVIFCLLYLWRKKKEGYFSIKRFTDIFLLIFGFLWIITWVGVIFGGAEVNQKVITIATMGNEFLLIYSIMPLIAAIALAFLIWIIAMLRK